MVHDVSGRAMPGVAVRAVQVDTGLLRTTVTGNSGSYAIEDLPIGKYRVSFTRKAGFAEIDYQAVEQAVGQTRTLNPSLAPSTKEEHISVTASSVDLDQTGAAIGSSVQTQAITDLPLNGRNWATLTLLVPGAIDQGGSTQRSIRFAGRGRDDMNITFDGVDATGIQNQAQKAFVRLAVPTDSISEFRVDTAQYSAEFGDANGARSRRRPLRAGTPFMLLCLNICATASSMRVRRSIRRQAAAFPAESIRRHGERSSGEE